MNWTSKNFNLSPRSLKKEVGFFIGRTKKKFDKKNSLILFDFPFSKKAISDTKTEMSK